MRSSVITIHSVKELVDAFYRKVRVDSELGPVFDEAIGESDEAWSPHLETMYKFWSTLMCKTECFQGEHLQYKGNPMKKHQDIPSFDEALFDRWLELFHETAREYHSEGAANQYIEASTRVAQSLKLALYYKPEGRRHEEIA